MDWTNDVCLQLIELYREQSCLWNPIVREYKNTIKKQDAWNQIAEVMKTSPEDVKKKMESLLASHRRERQKSMSPKSGSGSESQYKSKWFAYSSMDFLMDKYKPRKTINTDATNFDCSSIIPEMLETEDDSLITHAGEDSIKQIESSSPRPSITKREIEKRQGPKLQTEDPRIDTAYKILKDTHYSRMQKDQSDIFGQHVAAKHRKYSERTKSIVEHMIGNILFDADMGKFEPSGTPTCSSGTAQYSPIHVQRQFQDDDLTQVDTDENITSQHSQSLIPLNYRNDTDQIPIDIQLPPDNDQTVAEYYETMPQHSATTHRHYEQLDQVDITTENNSNVDARTYLISFGKK